MSCDPRPQPAADNAEEMDKRGNENHGSGHTSLDSGDSASSKNNCGSEEQWPLPSWPIRLCHKCIPMTSTIEGLRALSTTSGYIHHDFDDLFKSTDKGCVLCREILDHVIGRNYDQNLGLSYTWLKDNFMEAFVSTISIRGSFTYIPSSDEKHSEGPVLELRNLDIGRISRNGVRHTSPLLKPHEFHTRKKFDIFTDAQSPKWLHPNIVSSEEAFEVS
jgi:hypothetical protein